MRTARRVLLGAALALLAAPPARAAEVVRRLGLMGTTVEVRVRAAGRPAALAASEAAVRALEAADRRLSSWREDSGIAGLATGRWTRVPPALARDLAAAAACARDTGGAFDPTLGAGILEVRGDEVRATAPLDLGGIGKGIGIDDALAAALAAGAEGASVDMGGQVGTRGIPVEVALSDPDERRPLATRITLDAGSVATSGHRERPGHLLDPRSGRPAPDFGNLTVLAPTATRADCLSTALYVLGPEAARAWREPGVRVVVTPHAHPPNRSVSR